MSCTEYIYSNDYADFITDYNYNINQIEEIFEPDCINILSNQYAMVYKQIDNINEMSINEYGYNSFPKMYGLLEMSALEDIGVQRLRRIPGFDLKGRGVIVGFIDTGINYELDIFRMEDKSTRILGIWDQTIFETEEKSFYSYGRYYTREDIDNALKNNDNSVPTVDENGHGTMLASIAVGGEDIQMDFSGVAPESEIVVVKLKEAKRYLREYYSVKNDALCYQDTDIIAGILFIEEIAKRERKPLVICLGIGSTQGSHDGRSYLGALINYLCDIAGVAIINAGGNELLSRHHYRGDMIIDTNDAIDEIELNVGENISGFSMEMWIESPNNVSIGFVSPQGERIPVIDYHNNRNDVIYFLFDQTRIYINYVNLEYNSGNSLVFIRFKNPSEGIWTIRVEKEIRIEGRYDIWLPLRELISDEVYFFQSNPDTTLVSIANVAYSIAVSGYNHRTGGIFIESSRGYTFDERVKPDISAPADNIYAINPKGAGKNITGTSAAAALVAGSVAMLFEWADSVIIN